MAVTTAWSSTLGDIPASSVTGEAAVGQIFTSVGDVTPTQIESSAPVGTVWSGVTGDVLPSEL